MDEFIQETRKILPGRDSQLSQLFSYIGESDEPVPPCIYVYGNTSTGKSACVTATLKYLDYTFAFMNAVECYSPRILYETILNMLSGHNYGREMGYASKFKCDNMKDFITNLNNILPNQDYEPVIIVIDKAERLRDLDQNILPAFLRLKEFCNLNICTILLSNIVFEKYHLKTGLREPIKLFFPQYSKEELYRIIFLSQSSCTNYVLSQTNADSKFCEELRRPDLFPNYLNAFLSVFYRPCRDLVELRHMARIHYLKYCKPILDGSIPADDVTKLWRNIAPALKVGLEALYLRLSGNQEQTKEDPSSRDIHLRMERLGITTNDVAILKNEKITDELTNTKTLVQSFELPFYAKFLLIAAYLASYNPVKEDKRLFMKYHGKQRKRLQQVNAKAKLSDKMNAQLGPKFFTLDRLLAIFYAILEERVGLTANLLCQVSSLVALQLLAASHDGSKYRCTAGHDFVLAISRMVGFNLRKYLYDFI